MFLQRKPCAGIYMNDLAHIWSAVWHKMDFPAPGFFYLPTIGRSFKILLHCPKRLWRLAKSAKARFSSASEKSGKSNFEKKSSVYAVCHGMTPEVLYSPEVLIKRSGSGTPAVSRLAATTLSLILA